MKAPSRLPQWSSPASVISSGRVPPPRIRIYCFLLLFLPCSSLQALGKKLQAGGKAKLFETWMLEESDLVQDSARAYGERLVSEQVCWGNQGVEIRLAHLRHLYLSH